MPVCFSPIFASGIFPKSITDWNKSKLPSLNVKRNGEEKGKKAFGGKLSKSIKNKYSLKKWLHGLGKRNHYQNLTEDIDFKVRIVTNDNKENFFKRVLPNEKERRILVLSALNCF